VEKWLKTVPVICYAPDGVDLKGRDVVLALDFPGPTILDGNATYHFISTTQPTNAKVKNSKSYSRVKRVVLWK
jgi:hypothetical protein